MWVKVEFSGGLETLFANKRIHKIDWSTTGFDVHKATVSTLVEYLSRIMVNDERIEMLTLDGAVRPGILVLINDTDWELEGGPEYKIQPNDSIMFVSTLHGG